VKALQDNRFTATGDRRPIREVQTKRGQAGKVDRGREQPPVLIDARLASDACSPPAVTAPQHVRELAFDLGTVRAVVGLPRGILLTCTRRGEERLIGPHRHDAPSG